MLEKSPLIHFFHAGAVSTSIIAIKSNRGSCEAKMAKLLLKLYSQELISVKENDEVKEQFSIVINNLATLEEGSWIFVLID